MHGWPGSIVEFLEVIKPLAHPEEFGGNATFPQILLNNKKLGGCTDTVKYLKEHNLLDVYRRHAS